MALAVDSLIWTQFSKGVSSGHILQHASSTAFLQFAQLPINETKGDRVDLAGALKSLVEWSATDLLQVVNLLTDELGAITSSKQKKGPILQSQTILLDALGRCLLHQWDIVRRTFRESNFQLEPTEVLQYRVLPPPLSEELVQRLLQLLVGFLETRASEHPERYRNAANVFFLLSASNYEALISYVNSALISRAKERDTSHLKLYKHLFTDSLRLSQILNYVTTNHQTIKKKEQQVTLSRTLRTAIWNWIERFPVEYCTLHTTTQRFPGAPELLFDAIDKWFTSAGNDREALWLLQTALLLLCPDILQQLAQSQKAQMVNRGFLASKEQLIKNLQTSIKLTTSKASDIATICLIDFVRAGSLVSKVDPGLRHLAASFEGLLTEKLFSPQAITQSKHITEQLRIDFLVATFRLSPRRAATTLFSELLTPTAPYLFRRIALSALLAIAQSEPTFQWWPTTADAHAFLAHHLQALFLEYDDQLQRYDAIKADKDARHLLEKLPENAENFSQLIQLFRCDPVLLLTVTDEHAGGSARTDPRVAIVTTLNRWAFGPSQPPLAVTAEAASAALVELHSFRHADWWCRPSGGAAVFWEIALTVDMAIASALTRKPEISPDQTMQLVVMYEEMLRRRVDTLRRAGLSVPRPFGERLAELRAAVSAKVELALLAQLSSESSELFTHCAQCFSSLCDEAELTGEISSTGEPSPNTIVANFDVYRRLVWSAANAMRNATQVKGIRQLRRMMHCTAGNSAAWHAIYDRWVADYTPAVLWSQKAARGPLKPPPAGSASAKLLAQRTPVKLLQEWTNQASFLCALGGLVMDRQTSRVVYARTADKYQKKKAKGEEVQMSFAEDMLRTLLELGISDQPAVRKSAGLAIGHCLCPLLYPLLFRLLFTEIQSYCDEHGTVLCDADSVTYVEQALIIIKLILLSVESGEALPTDFQGLDNIEEGIRVTLRYIDRLPLGAVMPIFQRVRQKCCQLVQGLVHARHLLALKDEINLLKDILKVVVNWATSLAVAETREVNVHWLRAVHELANVLVPVAKTDARAKELLGRALEKTKTQTITAASTSNQALVQQLITLLSGV